MIIKLYITLSEAEKLIFEKILVVDESRQKVNRAQAMYSIALYINENRIIKAGTKLIIVSSAIEKYEIPESDEALFLNTYKLPKGLIDTKRRKFKDISAEQEPELIAQESDPIIDTSLYTPLRNAFIKIYLEATNSKSKNTTTSLLLKNLKNIDKLKSFELKLIDEIVSNKSFPKIVKKTGTFQSDSFFCWIWWGKFISDQLVKTQADLSQEQAQEHSLWLKSLDPDQEVELTSLCKTIPKLFVPYSNIIIGYYLAFTREEQDISIHSIEQLSDLDSFSDIAFWYFLFSYVFNEELTSIFPISLVREQFSYIEENAFALNQKIKQGEEFQTIEVLPTDETTEHQIRAYQALKTGVGESDIQILYPNDTRELFNKSLLFGDNKQEIGFITSDPHFSYPFDNLVKLVNGKFEMHQINAQKKVTYYGNVDQGKLPIKLNIKPYENLIAKNKTTIVGKILDNKVDGLYDVYANLINDRLKIDKIIIIREVDKEESDLHSIAYQQTEKEFTKGIEKFFGKKVRMFTKNKRNNKDTEIKRLIKQSLCKTNIKDIEVIDQNFDVKVAEWVISSFDNYIIVSDDIDYRYI